MADYSSFLFNSLNGIGDAVVDNRQEKARLAINNRDYARQLGLDEVAAAKDQRNYDYQVSQDKIQNDLARQRLALEGQRIAKGGDGTGNYFGTPLPYRKADGSIGYALPNKAGGVTELDLQGGQFLSPFEKASDTAAGKVEGANRGNLPSALAAGDRIVRGIDDVLADPYLPKMVGPVDQWLPNVSGDANRVQAKLDQIQGGTFLQAYNDLRGGGQITEKEGEKATAAYNRLSSMGQDNADYEKALTDFKSEVLKLMVIAKTRAGQTPAAAAPAAPSPNGAVDFRSYFGGQ